MEVRRSDIEQQPPRYLYSSAHVRSVRKSAEDENDFCKEKSMPSGMAR